MEKWTSFYILIYTQMIWIDIAAFYHLLIGLKII